MTLRFRSLAAAALLILASAPPAAAQDPAPQAVIASIPAKARLTVTSPAFKTDADMPFENTQYRGNIFPGLAWTAGPKGTKAYAVIMQDTDRPIPGGKPLTHWSLINVPAQVRKLDAAMTAPPAGSTYGPNFKGANQAYLGPHTPPGPKHHYHFQVFALDAPLADPGASVDALTASLQGHVLASGEVVPLAQVDPNAPPRPPALAPAAPAPAPK